MLKFMIQLDKQFIVTDIKSSYLKTCFVPLKTHAKTLNPLLENFECSY